MVAIDLDGTLLRSNSSLSRRSVDAVTQAVRQGVRIVLASARPPRSVRDIYKILGLDTLQINYNGAVIFNPHRKRHVYHQPLPATLAQRVVRFARRIDPQVMVSIEILDKWYTDKVDDSLPTETSRSFSPDFIGPLEAFLHVPATKLMFLAPPDRINKVHTAIKRKFASLVKVIVSDHHMIQVMHPKVDKANALSLLAAKYGIPQKRVMAIGDAPNDIGMLCWAGIGVAVENAWPQTRHVADFVVPSNDDDGVAFALRRHVLEPYSRD